ncbi:MAG: hypothetical protein GF308_04225 [Candidatus Heimdallarchaeota archaeon]|nr:hypothetical protein [Candidatus Heimdallarchaeota archaeon]
MGSQRSFFSLFVSCYRVEDCSLKTFRRFVVWSSTLQRLFLLVVNGSTSSFVEACTLLLRPFLPVFVPFRSFPCFSLVFFRCYRVENRVITWCLKLFLSTLY